MRRLYQTDWQGIPFSSFAEESSTRLAGPAFYDAFYSALFDRYDGYEAIDAGWRRNKDQLADWLAVRFRDGSRVLSVGCGLGYIEQRLWREYGRRIELHVQDFASQALRWLREVMPAERIHGTDSSEAVTGPERYDLIYLSAVDYALSDEALVEMLAGLRCRLSGDGAIVMISASFLDESAGQAVINAGKDVVKGLLERLGLYRRGQFWGWKRTRREYQRVMRDAGLGALADGFIETPQQRTYWIEGRVSEAA